MLKEEEIELDLGLSIGGNFRKPEKSMLGVELREKERQSPPVFESAIPDRQAKREVQALRRQEAKRKREEKRSRGRSDGLAEEQPAPQPAVKKERAEANVNVNVNLNLRSNGGQSEPRCPCPYPPAQFVPYANGFAYPRVMPCNWTPAAACGGFQPFRPHKDLGNNGCETEQNGGGACRTTSLSASTICSSSTVSDHQSAASHEGGGSSDNRSHSNQGLRGKTQLKNDSVPKETKANSDHKATSNSAQSNSQFDGHTLATKEEPKSENTEPISVPKPEVCPALSPPPLKDVTKFDPIAKPPKPQTQTSPIGALSQMPYVSTTGNGPNGKTIQGFLYSYTKSEISIVCVCHGSTFTPAEFVQHAGGTDVSQPLRHITVIPSAFGSASMI